MGLCATHKDRKPIEAASLLKELEANPMAEQTIALAAKFANEVDCYDEAILISEFGLSVAPNSAVLHARRGIAYHHRPKLSKRAESADFAQADTSLSKAIELEPERPGGGLWACRAELYDAMGKKDKALRDLEKCVQLSKFAGHWTYYAQMLGEDEQFAKAIEIGLKALTLEGDMLYPNMLVGWLYGCQGYEKAAVKYFDAARALDRDKKMNHLINDAADRAKRYYESKDR